MKFNIFALVQDHTVFKSRTEYIDHIISKVLALGAPDPRDFMIGGSDQKCPCNSRLSGHVSQKSLDPARSLLSKTVQTVLCGNCALEITRYNWVRIPPDD